MPSIYGRRTPEAESLPGATIVAISVVGFPDGADTAEDIIDHGERDYTNASHVVRMDDTAANRGLLMKMSLGYWSHLPADDTMGRPPMWEWRSFDSDGDPQPEIR